MAVAAAAVKLQDAGTAVQGRRPRQSRHCGWAPRAQASSRSHLAAGRETRVAPRHVKPHSQLAALWSPAVTEGPLNNENSSSWLPCQEQGPRAFCMRKPRHRDEAEDPSLQSEHCLCCRGSGPGCSLS